MSPILSEDRRLSRKATPNFQVLLPNLFLNRLSLELSSTSTTTRYTPNFRLETNKIPSPISLTRAGCTSYCCVRFELWNLIVKRSEHVPVRPKLPYALTLRLNTDSRLRGIGSLSR